MAIILVPGRYEQMLRDLGHMPEPVPDWSPLEFVDTNLTTDEWLMFEFARRGITPRKADDATHFTHTWLTAALVIEMSHEAHSFIEAALNAHHPEVAPLPVIMQYEFNEGFGRWVPVIPAIYNTVVAPTDGVMMDTTPSFSARSGAPVQETSLLPVPSVPSGIDSQPGVASTPKGITLVIDVDSSGTTAKETPSSS